MLQFGLRLGRHPRCVVATTPRPTKLIRELLAREGRNVAVTRGSTYENRANLAPGFFDQIIGKYEGTRLGRQELNAELLDDTPGALWSHGIIDAARQAAARQLTRIVVAIDPAATSGEDADETGIIVVGKDTQGHGYVLADASGKYQPIEWAKLAITAYRAHHADRIVAERNNGGAMVEATIRTVDGNVPVTTVWASRGKAARAEPVSALYEQGRAAGKRRALNRSRRSMNRAGSTTSAPSPSWRTRCAPSRRISIEPGQATRRTASMRSCGG
jgi:phage terminase large subunit-like protein